MNWALMVSNQLLCFSLSILGSCKSGNSLEKSLNSPLVFLLLFMKMFDLSCFHLSHIIFIVCFYVNIVHFLRVYYRCRCCFFTPMLLNAIRFYSKLIWLPSILRRFFWNFRSNFPIIYLSKTLNVCERRNIFLPFRLKLR